MYFLLSLLSLFHLSYSLLSGLISRYGYIALFGLLILEAASFPVPSEVILPITGYFIYSKLLNPFIAFAAIIFGGIVGMALDYYLAYFIGKDVVYRHLAIFHISREKLDAFDKWFAKNGPFTVFVSRLMPLIRGLINFPAGFALMPQKKFFAYSIAGTVIWDVFLISFGYFVSKYELSISNLYVLFSIVGLSIGLLAILLFLIYRYAMRRISSS